MSLRSFLLLLLLLLTACGDDRARPDAGPPADAGPGLDASAPDTAPGEYDYSCEPTDDEKAECDDVAFGACITGLVTFVEQRPCIVETSVCYVAVMDAKRGCYEAHGCTRVVAGIDCLRGCEETYRQCLRDADLIGDVQRCLDTGIGCHPETCREASEHCHEGQCGIKRWRRPDDYTCR